MAEMIVVVMVLTASYWTVKGLLWGVRKIFAL